jgi:predicted nucleic-acid-binding protein
VIAVDTNILLRLFIAGEPSQAAKAQRVFDDAAESDVRVWVSDTVLVELAWTLGRAYARERRDVVRALRALAAHATLAVESPAAVRSATDAFERGLADFADCLLSMKPPRPGANGSPPSAGACRACTA